MRALRVGRAGVGREWVEGYGREGKRCTLIAAVCRLRVHLPAASCPHPLYRHCNSAPYLHRTAPPPYCCRRYLTTRYDDLVKQVPLMAVHNAGRATVPSDIYTPPPLRSGGQGWHPEW